MAASEAPALVFRKTSFTMRDRFTPARACSTRTRRLANFRLVRFSAGVSSPRRGFFFRLAGLGHRGFVPLESRIVVQGRPRRIGDVFLIGDLLVMGLADIGPAQEIDARALQ